MGFFGLKVIEGVEIDYTSNEAKGVLAGIIAGNGNYIERVLGNLFALSTPEHEELKELVSSLLSRRVHRHYRGFATNQRKSFEEAEKPKAKKLLYVLRTALTGTHHPKSGKLRVDLKVNTEAHRGLAARYDIQGIPNFLVFRDGAVARQQAGVVPASEMARWVS